MDINIDKVTVNVINVTVQNPKSETKTGKEQTNESNIDDEDNDGIPAEERIIDSFDVDL